LSKTKAHAAAYPNNMKQATREVAAKKLAKKPKVRGEIERLTLELLPPVQDMRAAYHHSFSTIVQLTLESADDRLRFDAARWLLAECERREELAARREQLAEKAAPVRTEAIIAELRLLYEKAGLRPRDVEAPLVVEVDAESEAALTAAPAPELSAFAAGTVAGEASEADSRPAERETCLDSQGTERMFREEPVPGTFPQRFRKVPIR
jgi:hypothetical protein